MPSKWLAPACYVGVAALCALYLAIVPGVTFTNVAAGAGIGAALMWALNEWEAGKWKFERVVQALPAAPALATAVPVAAEAVPAAQPVAMAQPAPQPAAVAAREPVRTPPPPATSQSWEIDDAEPSWDPSALAETWAKLRRDLSISGSSARTTPPAPDLPRTAQLAKGSQLAKAQLPGLAARSAEAAKAPVNHSSAGKPAGSRYASAAPAPAKGNSYGTQPQQPASSSWSSRASSGQGSYGPTSHGAPAPSHAAQPAAPRRPTEPAPQRTAQQAPSFLRTSAMRPR